MPPCDYLGKNSGSSNFWFVACFRWCGFFFLFCFLPLFSFSSVVETHDSPTILRSCPSTDCDRIAEFPEGLRFAAAENQGEWTQAKLSSELSGWILTHQVKSRSSSFSPSQPVIKRIKIKREMETLRMEITESEPGAVIQEEWLHPPVLWLKFQNAISAIDEIDYAPHDPVIDHVSVWQETPDVVTVKIDLRGFYGYRMIQKDPNHLLVKFKLPSKQPANKRWIVCLDPGHGGKDTGAVGPAGLEEKNVTLSIAEKLGNLLRYRGYAVVFTRTADQSLSSPQASAVEELEERVNLARTRGADLFISIHCNAKPVISEARKARGTFVYYYQPQSYSLARAVSESLQKKLKEPEYGVIFRSLHVIRESDMPAVLVETLFISNPVEEMKLGKDRVQEAIARGIFQGIESYVHRG